MYDSQYEFITTLQYPVKSLQAQLDAFRSGNKYLQMEAEYKSLLRTEESRIHKLEVDYYCDGLGMLVTLRENDPSNIYTNVSEIFDRKYRWSD